MIDTLDDRQFECPQCGGLMSTDPDHARCVAGHAFTAHGLLLASSRASASQLWRAIRSLENTQRAARWALADPSFRVRHWLAGSALVNGQTAALLKPYARALDRTIGRLEAAPVQKTADGPDTDIRLIVPGGGDTLDSPGPYAS